MTDLLHFIIESKLLFEAIGSLLGVFIPSLLFALKQFQDKKGLIQMMYYNQTNNSEILKEAYGNKQIQNTIVDMVKQEFCKYSQKHYQQDMKNYQNK